MNTSVSHLPYGSKLGLIWKPFVDGLAHISVSSYHPNLQDFSMKSESTKLDHWVFRNANVFFKSHVDRCGKVCDAGNVFFLHLLGVDVAGHSSKPRSK